MQGEDELPQQLYSLWKDNEHLSDRSFVPENSLVDEPITIQLRNVHQENGHFPIGTHLFVSAFLYDEKENLYYSLSFFEMNNTPLDLSFCKALPFTAIQSSLKPVQGDLAPHFSAPANKVEDRETYTNIEKMAFIWSMKPVPGCRFGLRYSHRDVTKPMRVHIMIGKCYKQSDSIVFERITSGTTNRWYHREEYTIRKEISTETGVVGTLFTPRKPGKYLAVIDLFGTAGGITEFRAALLAERGFIAMALPYFGYKHLPESFYGITLEYFEEAIDWMSSLPMVDARKGIGLTGVSYGAELALLCGSYFSNRVGAVVAISTSDSNTNGDISYKGQLIPHASPNYDEITFLQMKDTRKDFLPAENGGDVHALIDGISTCQELITDPETPEAKKARIEYEKSQAALLLVSGRSDCNWPAAKFSRQIMDRLDKHQYAYGHKHICYELTGHLIEPPYAPFCSYSYHKILFGSIMWGGVGSAHNFAQEHSWHSILQFLRTSLQGSNL